MNTGGAELNRQAGHCLVRLWCIFTAVQKVVRILSVIEKYCYSHCRVDANREQRLTAVKALCPRNMQMMSPTFLQNWALLQKSCKIFPAKSVMPYLSHSSNFHYIAPLKLLEYIMTLHVHKLLHY